MKVASFPFNVQHPFGYPPQVPQSVTKNPDDPTRLPSSLMSQLTHTYKREKIDRSANRCGGIPRPIA